jgi:hypothetical protein
MNKTLLFSVVLLAVFASTYASSKHDVEIVINMGPKHTDTPTANTTNTTNITV